MYHRGRTSGGDSIPPRLRFFFFSMISLRARINREKSSFSILRRFACSFKVFYAVARDEQHGETLSSHQGEIFHLVCSAEILSQHIEIQHLSRNYSDFGDPSISRDLSLIKTKKKQQAR